MGDRGTWKTGTAYSWTFYVAGQVGTFTILGNTLAGYTFTIVANGTSVTLAAGSDFAIGASASDSATNLAAAINAHGTLGPLLTATASGTTVTIRQDAYGTTFSVSVTAGGTPAQASAVFDPNGAITGLVNADFSKQLAKDDAYDVTATTVTEIDAANLPGWYKATYTPASDGHWAHRVAQSVFEPRGWLDEVQVGAYGTLAEAVAGVWTLAAAIDGTITPEKALTYIFAAVAGESSGEPSTNPASFKGPSGAVRYQASYDANNNRSAVTLL